MLGVAGEDIKKGNYVVIGNDGTIYKYGLQPWLLNKEERKIWDKELPTMFQDTVIDPEYELDTYGESVSFAQLRKVRDYLKDICYKDGVWSGLSYADFKVLLNADLTPAWISEYLPHSS